MNTKYLTMVRKHFSSDFVSREVNRNYARKWVRMVRLLGSNWKGLPV